MFNSMSINQYQRVLLEEEAQHNQALEDLKVIREAREELESIPNHRVARIIDNFAEERLDEFEYCKREGVLWCEESHKIEENDTLYEREYDWDYGWYRMLAWLMKSYAFMAFFALLANVDTAVQEKVLLDIYNQLPAVYNKLIFWKHTYMADAASVSYQKYRRPKDPLRAAPFSDKIRTFNIEPFFKEFPLWEVVLEKEEDEELGPLRRSARLQEKERLRKSACSEEVH